jgi:hypothetical protein
MIDCDIVFHMTESFFDKVFTNIKYIKSKLGYFIKFVPNLAIIKRPRIIKISIIRAQFFLNLTKFKKANLKVIFLTIDISQP